MVKYLKKARLKFPFMLLALLVSSLLFFAFESSSDAKKKRIRTDAQMAYIPGGSFFMGASDEQIDNSLMNNKKESPFQVSGWIELRLPMSNIIDLLIM